jgi:hypothetical protein
MIASRILFTSANLSKNLTVSVMRTFHAFSDVSIFSFVLPFKFKVYPLRNLGTNAKTGAFRRAFREKFAQGVNQNTVTDTREHLVFILNPKDSFPFSLAAKLNSIVSFSIESRPRICGGRIRFGHRRTGILRSGTVE